MTLPALSHQNDCLYNERQLAASDMMAFAVCHKYAREKKQLILYSPLNPLSIGSWQDVNFGQFRFRYNFGSSQPHFRLQRVALLH